MEIKKELSFTKDGQLALRKKEWDLTAKLLKGSAIIKTLKLIAALLLLAGAVALFVIHFAVSDERHYLFIGAFVLLIFSLIIISGLATNHIKTKRVLSVYYKRVAALFDKEFSGFPYEEIKLTVSFSQDLFRAEYAKEAGAEPFKTVECGTEKIKANEFLNYVSIDFSKSDVLTLDLGVFDKNELSALRKTLIAKAESYTAIEEGSFGAYSLENLKKRAGE